LAKKNFLASPKFLGWLCHCKVHLDLLSLQISELLGIILDDCAFSAVASNKPTTAILLFHYGFKNAA